VLVIGGGIGGLTGALAFARTGAAVTLIEQAARLTDIGAGIQITPNGAVVLAALGLEPAAAALGVRAMAVAPIDGKSGRRLARFDLSRLSGAPYRFFHRATLIGMLADAALMAGVAVRLGARVVATGPGPQVLLADGAVIAADLVIGADGVHSVLRSALNPGQTASFTGQTAWRSVITADAPPEARIWLLPGRHVVTYPLQGGLLNIVTVRAQAAWAAEGWTHPDMPAALQVAFADACPELRAILAQITQTRLWGLFRHPVATHWHDGARVLLGDAAHPTLPFLAQGANLALEDAFVLARACNNAATLAQALARYQVLRVPRVTRAIAAAQMNAGRYHLAGPRRVLAHLGLRVVGLAAPGAFLRQLDWLYGHDVTV